MVKVLVVEDEASIREMIALNLRLAGMEAVEADSAEAALPLLEQRPGCDAAILDVMLSLIHILSAILEQAYEQYLVEDITGGGSEDLILMSTLEDSGVQIELLTVDKDGRFQQVAVMAWSGDKCSG